jgi:hypothetical protein
LQSVGRTVGEANGSSCCLIRQLNGARAGVDTCTSAVVTGIAAPCRLHPLPSPRGSPRSERCRVETRLRLLLELRLLRWQRLRRLALLLVLLLVEGDL